MITAYIIGYIIGALSFFIGVTFFLTDIGDFDIGILVGFIVAPVIIWLARALL